MGASEFLEVQVLNEIYVGRSGDVSGLTGTPGRTRSRVPCEGGKGEETGL